MASPRGRLRAPLLFATIATAGISSGCQADITGVADSGALSPPSVAGAGGTAGTAPEPSDWFAAVQQADCSTAGRLARTRIRRLSTAQWNNTVAQALGAAPTGPQFPKDLVSASTGFDTDADLNKVNVVLANAYFDAGESLADQVAPAVLEAHACLGANAPDAACASSVVRDYGARLFRRPITDEEATRYGAFLIAQAALDPIPTAVASLLRVMLLSPSMVYTTELGTSQPGEVALTPYEQASLISYTVADLPPDAALLGAAQNGRLDDAAERASHAQRLLQTPSARAKYADFWDQYLPLGDLRGATGVDAALVAAVEGETAQFFDQVVWQQSGSFRDLMTAPYTYGAPALAAVYGALTPGEGGRSLLPQGQRSGVLTQAAFLFLPEDASVPHKVVHRGLVVRSRMLCQKPPPPPASLMPSVTDLEPLGADATPRESFAAFRTSKPACAACHDSFQPIGLAFEQFDNLGRHRTTYESGRPVETAGELLGAGDASGPYRDAVEIAQRIGQSRIGELCFTKQYAEYALGRRLSASADACVIRAPSDAQPQTPVQKLAVVLSDIEARTHRLHH